MNGHRHWPRLLILFLVAWMQTGLLSSAGIAGVPQQKPSPERDAPALPAIPEPLKNGKAPAEEELPQPRSEQDSLGIRLDGGVLPIDLATALRLAGVQNPQILLARQRVLEAVAARQFAAVQILPSVHLGTNFDDHNGNLQQSTGNILQVNRNAYFVGFGAAAIAAGTVNIPGVGWNLNLSDAIYDCLVSRQFVEQMRFRDRAIENKMLEEVARAYVNLLYAEGRRVITLTNRQEARDVYRLTADFALAGARREADKDRAATELALYDAFVLETEGEVLRASTRLAELLNMTPATRLHPGEDRVVPVAIVPEALSLPELLAIAAMNRPELGERQAGIRQAFLTLQSAKVLPFSPNVIVGLSYGAFGGGSNLAHEPLGTSFFARGQERLGNTAERVDFDAVAFWALQNCGVGNVAMVREARSRLQTANLELLGTLEQVQVEVTNGYVRSHARFAKIRNAEEAVRTVTVGYKEDYALIRGNAGRPIELLDSLRLLRRSQLGYLDAIIGYNQAQIELYVGLGQPPADTLARPIPEGYVPSEAPKQEKE